MQIQEERIQSAKIRVEEPKTKTAEVQTIFRDSEAQTNPYTPDYIIDKENVPEVLSILTQLPFFLLLLPSAFPAYWVESLL